MSSFRRHEDEEQEEQKPQASTEERLDALEKQVEEIITTLSNHGIQIQPAPTEAPPTDAPPAAQPE